MARNIIEATEILDKHLSDDVIDYLIAARQGVALADVPDQVLKELTEYGLIDVVPFDHPRSTNAIKGVVVSEEGAKVLNVVDDRHRHEEFESLSSPPVEETSVDAIYDAQSTDKDVADNKSGAIKADDPRNYTNEREAVSVKSKKPVDTNGKEINTKK